MAKNLALVRIKRALHHQTTRASDAIHHPGDIVRVWRERVVEKRLGEWTGPYTMCSHGAAACTVLVETKQIRRTSATIPRNLRRFSSLSERGTNL